MARPSIAGCLVAAIALASGSCEYPATEVTVVLGTDVDLSIPMTITATVTRGGIAGTGEPTHTWTRATVGSDGGIMLPATFAITPGDGPHDATVVLDVRADAGGAVMHRRASFAFIDHRATTVPIFLTLACAAPATGCMVSAPFCTVQQRCEEQGRTCGNDASCVDVGLQPGDGGMLPDASQTMGCGAYHQGCCASGPSCGGGLTCVSNRCQRCTDADEVCCDGASLRPDATPCGSAPDLCHDAPQCLAGVCRPPAALPDGHVCAPASGACQSPGTCTAGVCGAVVTMRDGIVCAPTTDPCQQAGVCTAGACGAIANRADGVVCAMASDACHTNGTCTGGHCGAMGTRAEGFQWGSALQRCCGGRAVTTTSTANCGVCGLACVAGSNCVHNASDDHYYCSCTSNTQCFDHCCRTSSPGANLCVPGVCASGACDGSCPGGSRCFDGQFSPNYCYY